MKKREWRLKYKQEYAYTTELCGRIGKLKGRIADLELEMERYRTATPSTAARILMDIDASDEAAGK